MKSTSDNLAARRKFLASLAAAGAGSFAHGPSLGADPPEQRKPRIASINSIYRFRSHAYHIAGRFIFGYNREGVHHQPPFQLVRMYNDQYPVDDLGRKVCAQQGIQLSNTVAGALGAERGMDVDAVLLICEHGDYPVNQLGQIEYPRYEHFEQIVEVFRRSGRSVPVFVDKHLSYDHEKAHKMYAASRELGFGLMAGSSLPVTWRRPEIEPLLESRFREGLVCFGFDKGPAEIYLFHGLEALQCMLERRRGGETGVKSVVGLRGPAVWKAGDEGRWSWPLLKAALSRSPSHNFGDIRANVADPVALLIEYQDGTRGTVMNLVEQTTDICFAGQVAGQEQPLATWFVLPGPPGARFFDPLTANIEKFFASGKPPYPVERTLLTSTVLDLALRSLHAGGSPISHRLLDVKYQPASDSCFAKGRYTDA